MLKKFALIAAVLLVVGPGSARADWLFTPNIGVGFGGEGLIELGAAGVTVAGAFFATLIIVSIITVKISDKILDSQLDDARRRPLARHLRHGASARPNCGRARACARRGPAAQSHSAAANALCDAGRDPRRPADDL